MKNKIGTALTRRLSAVLCLIIMLGIFLFSSETADESSESSGRVVKAVVQVLKIEETKENIGILTTLVRKAGHLAEYALLGASFCLYFFHFSLSSRRRILFSLLASTAYAGTDEIHQIFVPGRACRILDVVIDALGSLAGISLFLLLFSIFCKIRRKSNKKL